MITFVTGDAMDQKTKVKIAFLYYTAGLTQDEIAKKLDLTRQKVNAVIGSLRSDGIVTVSICGLEQEYVDWENTLEQTFGLKRVIIAPDYGDPSLAFLKVAGAAAQYLDETIGPEDVIGVSWGRTLAATIREMRPVKKPGCKVIQLLGTQGMGTEPTKSDDIVRALANKLDCPTYMLYAPAVVSSPETKDLLLRERIIQNVFDLMKTCTVGIFGIGELSEDAPMYQMGFLTREDLDRLHKEGFRADIGMNPVRFDGSSDGCFLENRLLNADMACIRCMPRTIAVASGAEKAEAVTAVLRSGCVDTIVIDSRLAEEMIKLIEDTRRNKP